MQGKSSRDKGARGEREFRDLLRRFGYQSRRYARSERATADVAHDVGGIHFEVKRRNAFDPVAWVRQSRRDSELEGREELPVAVWKRNNGEWMMICGVEEFLTWLQKERYGSQVPEA